ncbi:hypothetical protein Tco_1214058 [Tanacetum coccineum]
MPHTLRINILKPGLTRPVEPCTGGGGGPREDHADYPADGGDDDDEPSDDDDDDTDDEDEEPFEDEDDDEEAEEHLALADSCVVPVDPIPSAGIQRHLRLMSLHLHLDHLRLMSSLLRHVSVCDVKDKSFTQAISELANNRMVTIKVLGYYAASATMQA